MHIIATIYHSYHCARHCAELFKNKISFNPKHLWGGYHHSPHFQEGKLSLLKFIDKPGVCYCWDMNPIGLCVCVCVCARVYIHAVVVRSPSCVSLFATPRTAAFQGSLSMGFSRQEYWSGLSLPSPRDLPNPGIKPRSPAFHTDSLPSEPQGKPLV